MAFLLFLAGLGVAGWQLLVHPATPLPAAWNPLRPLQVTDPLTPITNLKLARSLSDDAACLAALETGAGFDVLPDLENSAQCHIRPRVALRFVADARLAPVETRCQTALRTAMWMQHGLSPAARLHLGEDLRELRHFSSYNCRAMRTGRAGPERMSTHATADAIDIAGFVTRSGRQISLKRNWTGPDDAAAFLRAARDSACRWFRVTLGPDYNSLHADHFHLQHSGRGLCR